MPPPPLPRGTAGAVSSCREKASARRRRLASLPTPSSLPRAAWRALPRRRRLIRRPGAARIVVPLSFPSSSHLPGAPLLNPDASQHTSRREPLDGHTVPRVRPCGRHGPVGRAAGRPLPPSCAAAYTVPRSRRGPVGHAAGPAAAPILRGHRFLILRGCHSRAPPRHHDCVPNAAGPVLASLLFTRSSSCGLLRKKKIRYDRMISDNPSKKTLLLELEAPTTLF